MTAIDTDLATYLRTLYEEGMRAPAIAEHTGIPRHEVIRALRATGTLAPAPAPTAASVEQLADRYIRQPAQPEKPTKRPARTARPARPARTGGGAGVTALGGGRPTRKTRHTGRPTGRPPTHPQLADPAWLQAQADASRTPTELADELGCTRSLVSKAYRAANIAAHSRRTTDPRLNDPRWLQAQADASRTATDIATELGCARSTAANAANRHHIDLPVATPTYPQLNTPNWLADRATTGRTATELADELGCSPDVIRRAAARHHIDLPVATPTYPQLNTPDWIRARADAGLTANNIAAELGCTPSTVRRAAERHHIDLPAAPPPTGTRSSRYLMQ